ncbi:hypothetical protein [Pseudomonas rhodesiae]|jgi:hypothetical protein|uniref:hypothetical protein n=1 Tax=Pseudomonas rhodesiae TaxID=76760 RepID=UPI00058D4D60|nr:hypothetical protein [Pseudomonas rhodesiae]
MRIAAKHTGRSVPAGAGQAGSSGFERYFLISLGQLRAIVGMFPGLRFFLLVALPGLLLLRFIVVLRFIAHCHLPSQELDTATSIEQDKEFGRLLD